MFDTPEEKFGSKQPVARVAIIMKPGRRAIPGAWHHLMRHLASLRGIGAGTVSSDMKGADMEVTVWYDEPEVMDALFEALKAEQAVDVESFKVMGH
jgi:hypothetical protein